MTARFQKMTSSQNTSWKQQKKPSFKPSKAIKKHTKILKILSKNLLKTLKNLSTFIESH
jgi:hypothetical protein